MVQSNDLMLNGISKWFEVIILTKSITSTPHFKIYLKAMSKFDYSQ